MARAMQLAFAAVLVLSIFVNKLNACTDCASNGGEYNDDCKRCICEAMSECKPKFLFQDDASKYVFGYMGLNLVTWNQCYNPGSAEKGLDLIGCARDRDCSQTCVDTYTDRFYGSCDSNFGAGCSKCCKQAAYLRLNLKNDCMNSDGDKFWEKVETCLKNEQPPMTDKDCLCFIKGRNKKELTPGSGGNDRSTRNECHLSTGEVNEVNNQEYWRYTDYDGISKWSKADSMMRLPENQRDQCTRSVCYRLIRSNRDMYTEDKSAIQSFTLKQKLNMWGTGNVTEINGEIYVQIVSYIPETTIVKTSWIQREATMIVYNDDCDGRPKPADVTEKTCYCIEASNGAQLRNNSFPRGPYKVRTAEKGECFNSHNTFVRRATPEGDTANYVGFRDPIMRGIVWTPDIRGLQYPDSYCSGLKPSRLCLKTKRIWRRVLRYLSSPEEAITLEKGEVFWGTGNVAEYDGSVWLEFYYDHEYITYWIEAERVFLPFSEECSKAGVKSDTFLHPFCTCFIAKDKAIKTSFRVGKNKLGQTLKSNIGDCYEATGHFYKKGKVNWQEFIHPDHGLVMSPEGGQQISPRSACGLA